MISTNYSKNDWLRLVGTIGIIYFCLVLTGSFFVYYFFIPFLDEINIMLDFIGRPDVAPHFWQHWAKSKQIPVTDEAVLNDAASTAGRIIFSMALWFVGYLAILVKVTSYAIKLCKKLKINPIMALVVFKKKRYWFKVPLGKLK